MKGISCFGSVSSSSSGSSFITCRIVKSCAATWKNENSPLAISSCTPAVDESSVYPVGGRGASCFPNGQSEENTLAALMMPVVSDEGETSYLKSARGKFSELGSCLANLFGMGNLHTPVLPIGSEFGEWLACVVSTPGGTSKACSESSLATSTSASRPASVYGLQIERVLLNGVVVLGELNPPALRNPPALDRTVLV
jgi:hypothetical protein